MAENKEKSCCCVKGHKIRPSIDNIDTFLKGKDPYAMYSTVPNIQTEGVCDECSAVVRKSQPIEDKSALQVISRLMEEIHKVKEENELLKNQNYVRLKESEQVKPKRAKKK